MSWDLDYTELRPCPCGKGEWERKVYSDDWNGTRVKPRMLCAECRDRYVWDDTVIRAHPRSEIRRGWVLKTVLRAESDHRAEVEKRAKELYYARWRSIFDCCRTKKGMWEILTHCGRDYPQSLSTFYDHTKGKTDEEIRAYVDSFFRYDNLRQVFEVCGIETDSELLGLNEDERKTVFPSSSRSF